MSEQRHEWSDEPGEALFSTAASDYAEVVPDDVPRTADGLWSTASRADASLDESSADAEHSEPGDAWWTRPVTEPVDVGGVFSAEPVERAADVVDSTEADAEFEPEWSPPQPARPSLFGSAPVADAEVESLWRDLDEVDDGPDSVAWEATPGRPPLHDVADPNGFERAVGRLDAEDRELAAVPIAVCGALLDDDEIVLGALTGNMLGRPAAVVVTTGRVLIANDRRWQPLVDIYRIGAELIVRGRHDRSMAALSFSDGERLSMVDGITDVELAIELADAIRDPEPDR